MKRIGIAIAALTVISMLFCLSSCGNIKRNSLREEYPPVIRTEDSTDQAELSNGSFSEKKSNSDPARNDESSNSELENGSEQDKDSPATDLENDASGVDSNEANIDLSDVSDHSETQDFDPEIIAKADESETNDQSAKDESSDWTVPSEESGEETPNDADPNQDDPSAEDPSAEDPSAEDPSEEELNEDAPIRYFRDLLDEEFYDDSSEEEVERCDICGVLMQSGNGHFQDCLYYMTFEGVDDFLQELTDAFGGVPECLFEEEVGNVTNYRFHVAYMTQEDVYYALKELYEHEVLFFEDNGDGECKFCVREIKNGKIYEVEVLFVGPVPDYYAIIRISVSDL